MGMRLVEFRSYKLKPQSGTEFHRLVVEQSVPLLEKFQMDLVAHGPSVHDQDCYYLIRAYHDLEHLTQSQEELYSSDDWRLGPREAIISLIESGQDSTFWLSDEAIESIREGRSGTTR